MSSENQTDPETADTLFDSVAEEWRMTVGERAKADPLYQMVKNHLDSKPSSNRGRRKADPYETQASLWTEYLKENGARVSIQSVEGQRPPPWQELEKSLRERWIALLVAKLPAPFPRKFRYKPSYFVASWAFIRKKRQLTKAATEKKLDWYVSFLPRKHRGSIACDLRDEMCEYRGKKWSERRVIRQIRWQFFLILLSFAPRGLLYITGFAVLFTKVRSMIIR